MTYSKYCAKISKAALKRIKPHLRVLAFPLPTILEVEEDD